MSIIIRELRMTASEDGIRGSMTEYKATKGDKTYTCRRLLQDGQPYGAAQRIPIKDLLATRNEWRIRAGKLSFEVWYLPEDRMKAWEVAKARLAKHVEDVERTAAAMRASLEKISAEVEPAPKPKP